MESARTFKESSNSYIDGRCMPMSMQLENILLKVYKSAEDILEEKCSQTLAEIVQDMAAAQQNCLKCVQSAFFLLLTQIQTLQRKNTISIQQRDYQVLQQSLQKAESQVRKHIRIQQQLKLYLDGLEQKTQNLQKQLTVQENKYHQLFDSMKSVDQQRKDLQKKFKKIEERNKYLVQREKLKGHKSAKLISQSFNRAQNNYSMQMYKSKQALSNHHHSKSKTSEKSFQKERKQIVVGLQKKMAKIKQLDEQFGINISKNLHQEPKQDRKTNNRPSYDKHEIQNTYIPTQQDIQIFRQMTKTVQMKQAYKRPVRKVTKYKTESKEGKQFKDAKASIVEPQNRQYRSVSMYK